MRLRALPAALATLLTVVALAGCGSDQPADGTGPPPSPAPAATSTPATTPATTVVPAFTLGTSVDTVVVMLEQAGLVAEVPDVDDPHYAVATDPAAGVEVPIGTTVSVLVGDG